MAKKCKKTSADDVLIQLTMRTEKPFQEESEFMSELSIAKDYTKKLREAFVQKGYNTYLKNPGWGEHFGSRRLGFVDCFILSVVMLDYVRSKGDIEHSFYKPQLAKLFKEFGLKNSMGKSIEWLKDNDYIINTKYRIELTDKSAKMCRKWFNPFYERDELLFSLDPEDEDRKIHDTNIIAPKLTFDKIILNPEVKRKLDSALVQYEKRDSFVQMGISGCKAITMCFSGPPGTGKTMVAEAFAKAIYHRLLVVNYSELLSKWVGGSEKNISSVFKQAKIQHAVLFFDEADGMAYSREYSTARWENTETNVFLKELEKFEGVCIFATNFKKKFDPAFERRLSLHIEFEKPKEAERLAIWQIHTKKCKLSKGVDFEYLAKQYDFSGGDIKNALINAARLALLEGNVIKQNHLEEACNSVKGKENKEKQNYFG